MLPSDFYIDRMRLLLLYDCLKSERSVVRMWAEVSADDKDVVRLCNEFNFSLKWSSKAEIKEAVLQKFTDNMRWLWRWLCGMVMEMILCARILINLFISYHMYILFIWNIHVDTTLLTSTSLSLSNNGGSYLTSTSLSLSNNGGTYYPWQNFLNHIIELYY